MAEQSFRPELSSRSSSYELKSAAAYLGRSSAGRRLQFTAEYAWQCSMLLETNQVFVDIRSVIIFNSDDHGHLISFNVMALRFGLSFVDGLRTRVW